MKVSFLFALLVFSATNVLAQGVPVTVTGPIVTKEPAHDGGGTKAECPTDAYVSGMQLQKDPDQTRSINVWCTQKSPIKICAPFVPNVWRTVTPVPAAWTMEDCRNMGQAVGASTLQVGCFFDQVPAGQAQRYVFGGNSGIASPPSNANIPNPNCGW